MNRILGSLPNNYRQIEPELMRLEILNTRQSVEFLSKMDQFGHDEMRRFWMYSRTIQESTISGKKPFPGEMLKPFSENIPLSADGILNLMIAYYNDTYENLKFRKPFETDSLNSIIIPLKINKYSKFTSEDDSIDIYPGQIQFFFVHEISTNRINIENHYLAYVRWYKKIKNRFYFDINQEQICNVELWDTEFYPKS
ncbi:hypothetical protein Glove_42g73 [Diversispora epigaea]|uniref:Uncharacterized protein n=1 Tax=Diversispora epigaea TaxID=1348612 RepID=A0A397JR03_9GLOM|nr:hypothetical protein Glove_42g73 [Diversispora epigaea]